MTITLKTIGSLQKGAYVVIDGVACKVADTQTSRPGKHGHAKVRMQAVGILDGKKREIVKPGHDKIEVPVIDKRNAQVLSIQGNTANCMDTETFDMFDLEIPDELKSEVADGVTVLYWQILEDKLMVQVVK
ncbi:MAG: translation initiation factor IF-5A [Candidatus Nanoarchaeia archaeon]